MARVWKMLSGAWAMPQTHGCGTPHRSMSSGYGWARNRHRAGRNFCLNCAASRLPHDRYPRLPPPSAHHAARRHRRQGHGPHRQQRQAIHRCLRRRRGFVPGPRTPRRAGRHARADRQARVRAHQLLHDRGGGGTRQPLDRARARRHEPRLLRERRLRGRGSGHEDGAPVFRREGPAAAQSLRRAPPELPRQHAGRIVGGRQPVAARTVRAPSHPRHACVGVLPVPRAARRRVARTIRPAAGTRTRRGHRAARQRQGDRLHGRDRWRRHGRRAHTGAWLFQGGARGLRPARRAARSSTR